MEFSGGRTAVENAADEHTGVRFLHAKGGALCRVEHGKIGRGEVHVAVVGPVLDVLEEAANNRCRNHVADILSHGAAESLESDADNLAVLHDRTPAVARVDRGVDLDGKMAVDFGVAVGLEVDPGDHAGGDGKAVAADGVAVGADRGFQGGDAAELEGFGPLEKPFVINAEDGEVAIVGHMQHASLPGGGITLLDHGDEGGVAYHVGVGHDAFAFDDKTCSHPAADVAGIPGSGIIGLLRGGADAHHAGGRTRGGLCSRDEEGGNEQKPGK